METVEEKLKRLAALDAGQSMTSGAASAGPAVVPNQGQVPFALPAGMVAAAAPAGMLSMPPAQAMMPQPMAPQMPQGMAPAGYPWAQPAAMAPQALPKPIGIAIQMAVPSQAGEATAYVMFGPEWASTGAAAQQLVANLQAAGWPVKAWNKIKKGGW